MQASQYPHSPPPEEGESPNVRILRNEEGHLCTALPSTAGSHHCSEISGDGPASKRVLPSTPSLPPLRSPDLLLYALYFCTFENHFVSLTFVSYNIKCRVLLAPGEGFCGPSQVLLRVHPTASQVQVPDNPWQKNRDHISAAHACGGPRWREFHLRVCLGNIISSRLSLFPSI